MEMNEALVSECRAILSEGGGAEEVLEKLRHEGLSKIESIKILRLIMNIGLGEAKELAHNSKVWADVFERDNAFHEALWEAWEEVQDEL